MGLVDLVTGGGLTWMWDQSGYSEASCLNKANAAPLVKQLDGLTEGLARDWHPTGYYSSKDIRAITSSIIAAGGTAKAAVLTAPRSTSDADEAIGQAVKYIDRNTERAQTFITAADTADSGKGIVDAPSFKTFVTNSLINISQAYVTLGMLSCAEGWFQHGIAAVNDVITKCKNAVALGVEYAADAVKASYGFLEFITSKPFRYTTLAVGTVILGFFVYFKAGSLVARARRARHELMPGSKVEE